MNKENKLQASLPKGFKDRWGDELALKNKLVDTIIEENLLIMAMNN